MDFKIYQTPTGNIAELQSDEVYAEVDEFVDILGNANYQGTDKLIMQKSHFHPDFFELKTKLAGEVLQKFSNYRQKLAIVGDFSNYTSKSLRDFIRESNKLGHILFVESVEEALKKL
ncbi:MAG: DUF4180 domain-containing protein [Salinivirgaceae bacterium]|nr:MAG: DUF4180 domain-containing protein [Salinivirgaceae bacterium]